MENSPSDDHVAAVAARLPPVRYYVPYEEEEEEEPVQDPDSPQSPDQVSYRFPFPPLVFLNRREPLFAMNDDEPTPPAPESPPAAWNRPWPQEDDEPAPTAPESPPAAWTRPWPQEDDDLYYAEDEDDPESVRKGWEVHSKRYAVLALRHYNADPCNTIKYELVEATDSNGIVLDWGGIIGHVTFTARAVTGHDPTAPQQADPRPFFAEVRDEDLAPTCLISLDDWEEQGGGEEDDLCQFCGDAIKHPKVHPQLYGRPKRSVMPPRATGSATKTEMDCDP